MDMYLDTPRFLIGDMAKAAAIDLGTAKNWLNPLRSADKKAVLLLGEHDRSAEDTGHVRLFSLRRIMQAAVTAHLVRLGLSPRDAATLALQFTDGSLGHQNRKPGELFDDGITVLTVFIDENRVAGRLKNIKTDDTITRAFGKEFFGNSPCIAVVNCNSIVGQVGRSLGLS